jgi:hypothetical protein
MIPSTVLGSVRSVTTNLLDAREEWNQSVVGVGCTARDDKWCLTVYLAKDGIPPKLQMYLAGLPIPVVTVVTGRFRLLTGVGQISTECGGSGTITAVVKKHGGQFLLTCNHVLGSTGCDVFDADDQRIAVATDIISFDDEPIPADAGIARLLTPLDLQLPEMSSKDPIEPRNGDSVVHFGAVTRRGTGIILDVEVSLAIDVEDAVTRRFSNVALVGPGFAQDGDSGSLVINTQQRRPTAIVFAKGEFEQLPTRVAICSLQAALAKLHVSIA